MSIEDRNQAEENLRQFNVINNAIIKASESIGITKEQGWEFFNEMTKNFKENE
jgi:hypothetical protein